MSKDVDFKDIGIINGIVVAWGGIIAGVLYRLARAMMRDALSDFEARNIAPMREQLHEIDKTTVKLNTWLEMSKARAAASGLAEHNSPYEINVAGLREMILAHDYRPDEVMVAEFRRIVADPETPDDDTALWNVIELRFGVRALAQEAAKFGAPGDAAPGIWVMCIRKAQEIGADALLREIGVLRD